MTKRLLIVHHTQSGNTEALASSVVAGAVRPGGVEVRSLRAAQAGLADLLWCDGLLLGTPENFGALSGMMKDFLDRTYYPAEGKLTGLPYAMFVSCDNDGGGAVRQLERIATGYGWKRVAAPVICHGVPTDAHRMACEELGETLAAGMAFGVF